MQSLSSIIFEDINGEYGYGMYLGLKIMICKRNGFVNATKLCAKFDKRLKHWLENQSSKELIEEVRAAGIPATLEIKEGTLNRFANELSKSYNGTYVNKLIIPHIASWISPSVGIKVSQIVNEFVVSE
jgi:hypothetical protein